MPSSEHEAHIALARLDPSLVAWLLAHVFRIRVPSYHHVRPHAADVRVLVPATYHADAMLVFCDEADRPVLSVVLEVQRGWDRTKRRTWKLYVAQLEAEMDVDVGLLVYCPDDGLAARYRMMAFEGISLALRPMIFTPDDVPFVRTARQARASPALAVLSAICHGADPKVDLVFPALAEALRALSPKEASLYYDVVLAGLPKAARARWEEFMDTVDHDFRSEFAKEYVSLGRAEGEARGEARAVLTVLDGRGVPVPADVRDQILRCTDLGQLDTWLRRAIVAATAAEVIGG